MKREILEIDDLGTTNLHGLGTRDDPITLSSDEEDNPLQHLGTKEAPIEIDTDEDEGFSMTDRKQKRGTLPRVKKENGLTTLEPLEKHSWHPRGFDVERDPRRGQGKTQSHPKLSSGSTPPVQPPPTYEALQGRGLSETAAASRQKPPNKCRSMRQMVTCQEHGQDLEQQRQCNGKGKLQLSPVPDHPGPRSRKVCPTCVPDPHTQHLSHPPQPTPNRAPSNSGRSQTTNIQVHDPVDAAQGGIEEAPLELSGDEKATEQEINAEIRRDLSRVERRTKWDLLADPQCGSKMLECLHSMRQFPERITRPREAAQDAEVFARFAEQGAKLAKAFTSEGVSRTPAHLVRALQCLFGNPRGTGEQSVRWSEVGGVAGTYFRWAPGVSTMLCPDHVLAPRPARQPQPRRKPQLGPVVRPEDRTIRRPGQEEEEERQVTDRICEVMFSLMEREQDVDLVDLVLCFNSFSQTVENIFALSFLVKDGKLGMMVGAKGEARITFQGGRGCGQQHQGEQFVMCIDMVKWEDWKHSRTAKHCLMPVREVHQH